MASLGKRTGGASVIRSEYFEIVPVYEGLQLRQSLLKTCVGLSSCEHFPTKVA